MFDHKHYVPVLKTKAGERWAVDHLKNATRKSITPLFEFHKHKTKDNASHVEDLCEDLGSVWGPDYALFIDTLWLSGDGGNESLIASMMACLRTNGLQAIPVARLTFDESSLDTIVDAHKEDGRGFALRIPVKECSEFAIQSVLDYTQVEPSEVHVILDCRHHPMDLPAHLTDLPFVQEWATVTVASGASPRTLTHLPLHSWNDVSRHDWLTWRAGIDGKLERKPAFGDYVTRDPGPPAEGGKPSVSVRYAVDDCWKVWCGDKFGSGASAQMHEICADLVGQNWYKSEEFSHGDLLIAQCSRREVGPGAPQQWLQWALNHHIELTVEQIAAV